MTNLTPKPNGHPIKLVRDLTAKKINPSGEPGDLFYGSLPLDQVGPWLRRKLMEEVAEYLEDRQPGELADVLAVIEGLALNEHDMSLEELRALADADVRGGFVTGQMMFGFHPEYDGAGR